MSELTIYKDLRAGGLTPAGACAVMGNMYCESAMIPNNVENRCTLTDEEYTSAVDDGRISPDEFIRDAFGYGLCQWTYWSRKKELWQLAKSRDVSVGDDGIQCELCLTELKRDYPDLYRQLCSCTEEGLMDAVEVFCSKYENPAVKNVAPRYQAAVNFYAAALEIEAPEAGSQTVTGNIQTAEPYVEIGVPTIRKGSKGRQVAMLQAGLKQMGYYKGILSRIDGDFGEKTEEAVKAMQEECNCYVTGIADQGTWQVLFQ